MNPKIQQLIHHYGMTRLAVEGTYYASTYRGGGRDGSGDPVGTAIVGLYVQGDSLSCFHRLDYDEVWHFYDGDPLTLYLLHPDGASQEVVLGPDITQGQVVQFTVPAGSWQGGCVAAGGEFSLYGCTMAPGFVESCFEAGIASALVEQYPDRADIIHRLSVNGDVTHMI